MRALADMSGVARLWREFPSPHDSRAYKTECAGEYASTKIVGNTVSDEKDQECQGRTE